MAERGRRAPLWVWPLLAATTMVPPAAWLLMHRLSSPTTPMWTEADLPTPPPEEDNGWVAVWRRAGGVPVPEVPPLQTALDETLEMADRLRAVDDGADALVRAASAERAAIDDAEQAISARRYADACPFDLSCNPISVIAVQKLVDLRILALAIEGDYPRAFALTAALVRAQVDYAGSARTLITETAGVVALLRAFGALDVLLAMAEREGTDAATWNASRLALARALDDLEAHPPDPPRAVVGDYLYGRKAFESVSGTSIEPSPWLIDRRATTAAIDDYYRALHDYASGSTATAPGLEDPLEAPFWWIYNPGGKRLISALFISGAPVVERLIEYRDGALARGREIGLRLDEIGSP